LRGAIETCVERLHFVALDEVRGAEELDDGRRADQDESMNASATGAKTPEAAVTLGRLIGNVLLALLRATPPGRWLERESGGRSWRPS
jgi:hypothetical protein